MFTVLAVLAVLLPSVALADADVSSPAVAPAVACPGGFSSLPRDTGLDMSQAPITRVQAGQHPCFDRLVVDVNGPIGDFTAKYVDQILGNASGLPIPTAGKAFILLVVRNPASDVGPVPLPSVAGFPALRGLVNAGSFEGVTAFGIGARARLPFRVILLPGRLVLDVAHSW
jgi:hypothetical protein